MADARLAPNRNGNAPQALGLPIAKRNQYQNANIRRLSNGYEDDARSRKSSGTRASVRTRTQSVGSPGSVGSAHSRPSTVATAVQQILAYEQKKRNDLIVKFQAQQNQKKMPEIKKDDHRELSLEQVSNDLDDILGIKESPEDAEVSLPVADDCPAANEESQMCWLDRDDCPPVVEQDHFFGRCLCYLCTCGKHICPALVQSPIIPSKAFKSSNTVDFTPSKHWRADRAQRAREEQQIIHSTVPMVLDTTNKETYKGCLIKSKLAKPRPENLIPSHQDVPQPFVGRTLYQADFPDFGPVNV